VSGTRFITKKFVSTLVPPDEAKLQLRGDVDAALEDAALVAKRNSRLGGEPAIIGALGSVACAIPMPTTIAAATPMNFQRRPPEC
jgi:hypothetical protein